MLECVLWCCNVGTHSIGPLAGMVSNYHCILHITYTIVFFRGPDPLLERVILRGKGQTVVKYNSNGTSIASSVFARAKRMNRSRCRLGYGLEWTEGCTSSIVFARCRQCPLMGRHVAATWPIRLNHPFAAAMRLMSNYSDHLIVIFGYAHLDSRIDSRALQAEYCIVGIPHNTAI